MNLFDLLSFALIEGLDGLFHSSLCAIPFFILCGALLYKGGYARKLVTFITYLFFWLPGKLLLTNIVANTFFGTVSGSASASARVIGGILRRPERRRKYDPALSTAANAASAPAGLLIPPSNALITYSVASGNTSISALFLAGYIPGLIWMGCCLTVGFLQARKKGYPSRRYDFHWKVCVKLFLQASPVFLMILLVITGVVSGVFTVTEGSAFAVVYCFLLCLFQKDEKDIDYLFVLTDSCIIAAEILFEIFISTIISRFLVYYSVPALFSGWLQNLNGSPAIILIIINLILLGVGTICDMSAAILIFTPIFLPIVKSFGMGAVQFGIMLVFNLCIGSITPPIGFTLSAARKLTNASLNQILYYLKDYYIILNAGLLMVMYIPELSLFLPTLFDLL